jgi:hypothetical protein
MNRASLVSEAKKHMENPDAIIDPLDLTFAWVSDEAAASFGYSASEIINKQIFDYTFLDPKNVREIAMSFIYGLFKHEIPIKTRDGKKLVKKIKYSKFEFENYSYLVAKFF